MILQATEKNIKLAAAKIKNGDIVAFPTETVYGLGADGLNPLAVAKIFEAKNRPTFNPLIMHISSLYQLENLVEINSSKIKKLIKAFWPGPLTLVMPKKNIVPDIVTAGHSTVAVRMPNHHVALKLIKESGSPIAAPSANTFGFLSPTSAKHVEMQLKKKIDYILDGGKSNIGVESTIIEVIGEKVYLLRPGGIALEKIESLVGDVDIKKADVTKPDSPGQLIHHYAPIVPLKFLRDVDSKELEGKRIGGLFFKEKKSTIEFSFVKILSPGGNMREAAANLFNHLHELEVLNLDLIVVEPIEETGLGIAIMDRLKRAANRYKNIN